MTEKVLYCVELEDGSENFDAGAELLTALEYQFSSWKDRENPVMRHICYFLDEKSAEEAEEKLRSLLDLWRSYGISITAVRHFTLTEKEWTEPWKKYLHTIVVSDRLAVTPVWLDYQPKAGQQVVKIDPGMSFGTGTHATTIFCLQMLDELAGKPDVKSLLDAGCGTGILAIAAAKLGYSPIAAFDNDPEAVDNTKENLRLNNVSGFEPFVADAETTDAGGRQYDLVCANILGCLLLKFRRNIARWVRPGGYLALSGILHGEYSGIVTAYAELGFKEVKRASVLEWTAGLFQAQTK